MFASLSFLKIQILKLFSLKSNKTIKGLVYKLISVENNITTIRWKYKTNTHQTFDYSLVESSCGTMILRCKTNLNKILCTVQCSPFW